MTEPRAWDFVLANRTQPSFHDERVWWRAHIPFFINFFACEGIGEESPGSCDCSRVSAFSCSRVRMLPWFEYVVYRCGMCMCAKVPRLGKPFLACNEAGYAARPRTARLRGAVSTAIEEAFFPRASQVECYRDFRSSFATAWVPGRPTSHATSESI